MHPQLLTKNIKKNLAEENNHIPKPKTSNRPLKLMLDISVLGIGYHKISGRTGIYRAIEGLFQEFLKRKDIRLTCTATRSLAVAAKSKIALQKYTDPLNIHIPFIQPSKYCADITISAFNRAFTSHNPTIKTIADYIDRATRHFPQSFSFSKNDLEKTDIFHATFYALPYKIPSKTRKILTIYDLIPMLYPKVTRWNERKILRQALDSLLPEDNVIAISQATKNDLCEFTGIKPERIFVIPLGASELFYPCYNSIIHTQIRIKYNIPQKAVYILSVATLEPRKNIPHLIKAFARFIFQEPAKELFLVLVGGKGWGEQRLTQLIMSYGIQDRIILTGYVQDEDLASIYSNALMFVYPSLYEGFGLPPLEAMQCGTPVITSTNSSLPEVVGDAGLQVNPTDLDGLCDAIFHLWRSTSLNQQLRIKSLARASQFSWQRCAEQTIDAYRQTLND